MSVQKITTKEFIADGQGPEIYTGALQIDNDWPGLFIRGDEAAFVAGIIKGLYSAQEYHENPTAWAALVRYADIILNDVMINKDDSDTTAD